MDASAWNERYRKSAYRWPDVPDEVLVEVSRDLPAGRALDLGCGRGVNSCWLASQGWHVTGVDFSTEAIASAQARARQLGVSVTWVQEDLQEWAPPTQRFDLVTLLYVQLAPVALLRLIRKARASLAPHGTLLVLGHDRQNALQGLGGPHNADLLYTSGKLRADVGDLVVERCETIERPNPDGCPLDTVLVGHSR